MFGSLSASLSLYIYTYMCIRNYIHIYIYTYIHIYMYDTRLPFWAQLNILQSLEYQSLISHPFTYLLKPLPRCSCGLKRSLSWRCYSRSPLLRCCLCRQPAGPTYAVPDVDIGEGEGEGEGDIDGTTTIYLV